MKPYLLSIGAGLLVGVLYSLMGVRSPAPPAIALLGLLGMLLGEQAVPVVKRLVAGAPVVAFIKTECAAQVLGPQAAASGDGDDPKAQA
jgi:XapX domain-containing protein